MENLKSTFETLGIALVQFPSEYLEDLPFAAEEIALLSECGWPVTAAPGDLRFAQVVHPEEGDLVIRCLSDEIPQYRHNATAQKIIVIAKDGVGNLIWINTASGHQVTLKDEAGEMNRYVNNHLESFLHSLAAYAAYQKNYDTTQSGLDQLNALREKLEAIDPEAFSDEHNFWRNALAIAQ